MNDQDFEKSIQASMIPATERPFLQANIDASIVRYKGNQRRKRRLVTAVCTTVVFGLAVAAYPRAYAAYIFNRISGSLDDVLAVRMTRFDIDDAGREFDSGVVDYSAGKWRIEQGHGAEVSYYVGGKLLHYEPLVKAYVAEDRPEGPFGHNPTGLKLSALIETYGTQQFNTPEITSSTYKGKSVLVASMISASMINEKLELIVDKETELPIESRTFVSSDNKWRLAGVLRFDYNPRFAPSHFHPGDGAPVITKPDFERKFISIMTSKELGGQGLPQGRIVIRAVDVALDGTVFVAYQAGDKAARWYKGPAVKLSDDLGTNYVPVTEMNPSNLDDQFIRESPDGKLELAVFVPIEPDLRFRQRRLNVSTVLNQTGKLVRGQPAWGIRKNGSVFSVPPRWEAKNGETLKQVPVLSIRVASATCGERPNYSSQISYQNFAFDIRAQILKASVRANDYQQQMDFKNAERWTLELIRLKREQERQGFGSSGLRSDYQNLEEIRKTLSLWQVKSRTQDK